MREIKEKLSEIEDEFDNNGEIDDASVLWLFTRLNQALDKLIDVGEEIPLD